MNKMTDEEKAEKLNDLKNRISFTMNFNRKHYKNCLKTLSILKEKIRIIYINADSLGYRNTYYDCIEELKTFSISEEYEAEFIITLNNHKCIIPYDSKVIYTNILKDNGFYEIYWGYGGPRCVLRIERESK